MFTDMNQNICNIYVNIFVKMRNLRKTNSDRSAGA